MRGVGAPPFVTGATAEALCEHVLLVRVGPGHRKFGDPYSWSFNAVRDGDVAVLKGAWREATSLSEWKADFRAVMAALATVGIVEVYMDRSGGRRIVVKRK